MSGVVSRGKVSAKLEKREDAGADSEDVFDSHTPQSLVDHRNRRTTLSSPCLARILEKISFVRILLHSPAISHPLLVRLVCFMA